MTSWKVWCQSVRERPKKINVGQSDHIKAKHFCKARWATIHLMVWNYDRSICRHDNLWLSHRTVHKIVCFCRASTENMSELMWKFVLLLPPPSILTYIFIVVREKFHLMSSAGLKIFSCFLYILSLRLVARVMVRYDSKDYCKRHQSRLYVVKATYGDFYIFPYNLFVKTWRKFCFEQLFYSTFQITVETWCSCL